MEEINTPTEFRKVLAYLEIPEKYRNIYLTYPMVNKMTINETQLDLIIMSILQQFNKVYKTYGRKADNSSPRPTNKDFTMLEKYMDGKSVENIIQDIIQLKLLIPNLSRPANVANMWDGIDQILTDLDVIDEISGVQNNNPATEIPDTSLFRPQSSANTRPQSSANTRPPSANTRPPSANTRPPSANTRPPSANSRPPSANTRPASANTRPASANTRPASANTRPASANTRPASANNNVLSSTGTNFISSAKSSSSTNNRARANNY